MGTASEENESEVDEQLPRHNTENELIDEAEKDVESTEIPNEKPKRKVHRLSLKKTEDFNAKLRKRGVVYIARIPPRMTPTKLKELMSVYGEVTRIFLQEEDAAARKRRRKLSGSGGKRYTEGWIEFEDKKIAKSVATMLNMKPITTKKRSHHFGDLWMLQYLRKFQWSHLTEKVAYERRVREQKLRMDTMQASKESAAYRKLVETGKKLDHIAKRKGSIELDSKMSKKHKPIHQIQPVSDQGKTAPALLGSLL